MPGKTRLQNDLLCVEWYVKLYSLTRLRLCFVNLRCTYLLYLLTVVCYTGKYSDAEDLSRVPNSGDFVPFTRTSEVLDPAHADSPLPVSREPTDMVKARKAYQRELNPAKYGQMMDHRVNVHVSVNSVSLASVASLLCVFSNVVYSVFCVFAVLVVILGMLFLCNFMYMCLVVSLA